MKDKKSKIFLANFSNERIRNKNLVLLSFVLVAAILIASVFVSAQLFRRNADRGREMIAPPCMKYDFDEGISGTFDILFWRVEGTEYVQFFSGTTPLSSSLKVGDKFKLPDGTMATVVSIDLTTGPKTIVIIEVCSR